MIADDHFDSTSRQCQWYQSLDEHPPLLFKHASPLLLDGSFKTAPYLPLSCAEVIKDEVVSRATTGQGLQYVIQRG
jgi:hypothetical protein